jgi:hypothetical protein
VTVNDGRGGTRQQPLGPGAFLVLGYAARLGRVTPYQLTQLAQGVSWFWDFPPSQLYVESCSRPGSPLSASQTSAAAGW